VTTVAHVAPALAAPGDTAGSAFSDSGGYSAQGSPAAASTYRQSNRYGYPSPPEPEPQARQAAMDSGATAAAAAAGRGRFDNSLERRDAGGFSDRREDRMAHSRREEGNPGGRREEGTYKVQPNDNYWSISEKTYGSGAYFKALAEYNRERVARDDRLQVGTVLQVPSLEELASNYPDLCPKASHRKAAAGRAMNASTTQRAGQRVYVVESGDTLMDIARRQLGKAARWGELYELNRDRLGEDHDYLTPGMELLLPEPSPGRGESLTERPRTGFTR
jgi:nucleoid-associated protein YgaU